MKKSEAIEILREELKKIPDLKKLAPGNREFKLWCNGVSDVIKEALDPDDGDRFSGPIRMKVDWDGTSRSRPAQDWEEYLENLDNYETALKSIIQKCEVLGFGEEPAARAKQPSSVAEAPDYLFDKMQFHPRVIVASKSLFATGHYAQAIFEAFKDVNNFVKEKTVLSLDGKALMSKVFNENAPIIRLNELLSQSDRDEQEGFKFLFMGAMVGIRNPKAHDSIAQPDPYRTLEYLGFASLLMKRIEEEEVTRH